MKARLLRKRFANRGGERGQAFVELCLVLPVLLSIVFAVIEIGTIAGNQVALQHAASDGARSGATWGCVGNTTCETNNATTAATNAALSDIKDCSPTPPTITAPVTSATVSDGSTSQFITVTVSCTYAPITPLGSVISLLGGAFNLNLTRSASTKMRVAQ